MKIKIYNKYEQSFGGRDKYFPCKLQKDRIGDCAIRAVAHATEKDYMVVMRDLFDLGLELGKLPNDDLCIACEEMFANMIGWFNKYGFFEDPVKNVKFVVDDDPHNNLILKDFHINKTPVHLFTDSDGKIIDIVYKYHYLPESMIEKLQELDSKSLNEILKEAEYYSSQRQQTSEE